MKATHLVHAALAALALAAAGPEVAQAQSYPARPIRLIVPFPPGGTADIMARLVSEKAAPALGQPIVVDNRAGGAGNPGADAVAKAAPDGYTLLLGTNVVVTINPHLFAKMPYDAMRDFVPVAMVGSAPNVLVVHPSVPASSVRELVALAKSKPGQLAYASGGNGSTGHLAAEMLKAQAGIDLLHVPYKGGPAAVNDTIAGQVQMTWFTAPAVLPHVKAGKLRALGITSSQRSPIAPELPTIAEAGFAGYEATPWFGVLAPAGTPRPIVDRLAAEIAKVVAAPDVREKLLGQGAEPQSMGPEAFAAFLREDFERWGKAVRASGAKVD